MVAAVAMVGDWRLREYAVCLGEANHKQKEFIEVCQERNDKGGMRCAGTETEKPL